LTPPEKKEKKMTPNAARRPRTREEFRGGRNTPEKKSIVRSIKEEKEKIGYLIGVFIGDMLEGADMEGMRDTKKRAFDGKNRN